MPLFRKRNKAGTAQGPVAETNPHVVDRWDFDGAANRIASERPTGMDNVIKEREDKELAQRLEQRRKSHGPDARF